ncbi:hypothetical protein Hanom_Chr08g00730651 [Helianthus anomalus]
MCLAHKSNLVLSVNILHQPPTPYIHILPTPIISPPPNFLTHLQLWSSPTWEGGQYDGDEQS